MSELRFTFDGVEHTGVAGDTLAAALLRAGVDVVGTSIYLGRPRGIGAAGAEEPNALVQVELGGGSEPMLRATEVELFDGLRARGLPGRGTLAAEPDPGYYDKVHAHCDVLVVGGGPAGRAAAATASATGARVILAESRPALDAALPEADELRVLTRTTAIGCYDAGYVVLAERRTDHLPGEPPPGVSRERLWHVRAAQVVLATGAFERPIVFAGNDLPGIMLAGAARTYVERHGVVPGSAPSSSPRPTRATTRRPCWRRRASRSRRSSIPARARDPCLRVRGTCRGASSARRRERGA